ncbi:MAG TPA: lysophospholipase [Polyangia bacterium]|nr:lysophospholipase [Polyangia bacterium]
MARLPDAEETLKAFDGLELHVERFDPPSDAPTRAVVVMVHGFSAHCGGFRHVADAFARAGYAVTAFDCRGHGRSQGRHGYVTRFSDYADDLGRVLDRARALSPGRPVAVAAHSQGAAISLDYLLRGVGTFDALVAAAPYLDLKMKVPFYKRVISPVMGAIWPTLAMGNEISSALTSRDPASCAAMDADPLVRHVATPRWFNEVRATQARLRASASLLKVPTFMPVAGDDRLVDSEASIAFAKAAGAIVDLKVYDQLFHELYLEPERDAVIADVVAWLDRRFPR